MANFTMVATITLVIVAIAAGVVIYKASTIVNELRADDDSFGD